MRGLPTMNRAAPVRGRTRPGVSRIRTGFGRLVLIGSLLAAPVQASPPETMPLKERYQLAQDLSSELLAREIASTLEDAHEQDPTRELDRAPTRFEVAVAVSEFLEVLDNLHAVAGRKPLVPIESNPMKAFETSSARALEGLKARY